MDRTILGSGRALNKAVAERPREVGRLCCGMWQFLRRAGVMIWRALRLRCPNCGGGPIFDSWLRMRTHCPRCHLPLERGEEGYQVGSYMFNIIMAELLFAAVFIGVLLFTWPNPPWDILLYGGMALMVLAPFLFFPFSKTLFLAFDLLFRPHSREEVRPAGAPGET
jgi:uncharacterized protein (DUF983 family)